MNDRFVHTDVVTAAEAIIGRNPPNNRSLSAGPRGEKHIRRLQNNLPAAAPLVRILQSDPVQDAFQRYDDNDDCANRCQRRYKRASLWIFLPLIAAAAIGLLCVMIPDSMRAHAFGLVLRSATQEEAQIYANLVPVWIIYLCLAATAVLSLLLNPARNYERWKEARGTAESLRRELFERVMSAGRPPQPPETRGENELPSLPLKLEYFRRYQFEIQDVYYSSRCAEHERIAWYSRILRIGFVAFLLGWAVLCLAATWSGSAEQGAISGPTWWSSTAARASGFLQNIEVLNTDYAALVIGLLMALFYGVALMYLMLNSSVRNAARYRITCSNFSKLHDELASARDAARADDAPAVDAFVARVHSIMSLELADWVKLQDLEQGRCCDPSTEPARPQTTLQAAS